MKVWLLLLLLFMGEAVAAPLPGTDLNSPRHAWWECHRMPNGNGSCCSETDGHALTDTEWRMNGDHYQIEVEGKWWDVPNTTVLTGDTCGPDPLPEGQSEAKVWYSLTRDYGSELADVHVYCFLPGVTY